MSTHTSTTDQTKLYMNDQTSTTDPAAAWQTGQTGTHVAWRTALQVAGLQKDEARANTKEAGQAAWAAARAGIEEWLLSKDKTDPDATAFHAEVLHYYGKARKGEASKIRTIALATANNGLDPNAYRTLGAAYAAALALTKVSLKEETDDAALAAAIAAATPDNAATGTPESMASTIMALGAEKAVSLILDAIGEDNLPAHRALLRELSKQVGERNEKVQAKTKAAKTKPAKDKTVPKAVASQPAPVKPAKTKPVKTKPAKADVKPEAVKTKPAEAVKAAKPKPAKTKPAKPAEAAKVKTKPAKPVKVA